MAQIEVKVKLDLPPGVELLGYERCGDGHGFGTGCLRFAGRVAPTPRKTRFRLLARLFRTGLITRRVPAKGFKLYPTSILLSQVQRSARTQY